MGDDGKKICLLKVSYKEKRISVTLSELGELLTIKWDIISFKEISAVKHYIVDDFTYVFYV